jgi:hypothetical protein
MYISMGHREPVSAATVCVSHKDIKTKRKEQGVVFDWFVTGRLQTQVPMQVCTQKPASRAGQLMSQVASQKTSEKPKRSVSRYYLI